MNQHEQERKQMEEYKKNPVANLSDSVNRSMIGNLKPITMGGCFTKIITLIIIIGLFVILSYCSSS